MAIVMSALTPHPPLAIPEIGKENRREVRRTIESLEELAKEIYTKNPDIIITISPHGPVFTDAISILDLEEIEGDFSDFACPEVNMRVKIDRTFIRKIKENASLDEIEVLTLSN